LDVAAIFLCQLNLCGYAFFKGESCDNATG
jgi:hypothetical protein